MFVGRFCKVKADRVMHSMSMHDVANYLGITYSSYTRKERGEISWSVSEAFKLAELFGYDVERFDEVFMDEKLRKLKEKK